MIHTSLVRCRTVSPFNWLDHQAGTDQAFVAPHPATIRKLVRSTLSAKRTKQSLGFRSVLHQPPSRDPIEVTHLSQACALTGPLRYLSTLGKRSVEFRRKRRSMQMKRLVVRSVVALGFMTLSGTTAFPQASTDIPDSVDNAPAAPATPSATKAPAKKGLVTPAPAIQPPTNLSSPKVDKGTSFTPNNLGNNADQSTSTRTLTQSLQPSPNPAATGNLGRSTANTGPAPNTRTPLGASGYTGDQATLGNLGRLPTNADPTITRAPLGSSPYTRDFGQTTGNTSTYRTQSNAYPSGFVGRQQFNTASPNGLSPSSAYFPSVSRNSTTLQPNSGYGVPNGSRPSHMDAKGIQRVD